jgi:dTDP-4-dehydrorhamnose 3,5-epimerase-like enzyme
MNKLVAITIDEESRNVIIIPEHWNHGQTGFENADVYLVIDAADEKPIADVCFTEDKSDWEINSDLGIEAEDEIVNFIKSQSPLTAL